MSKVIVINPRGIKGDEEYTNGVCSALKKFGVDLVLISNYYYPYKGNKKYIAKPIFFKLSEQMADSIIRKTIRLIEYFVDWIRTLIIIRQQSPNVIHVMWPVVYKIDLFFYKWIKRKGYKLLYTAHNVLPHSSYNRYTNMFRRIYEVPDKIILNGNNIFKEFIQLFPEYSQKVIVSKHGCKTTPANIIETNSLYDNIFLEYNKVFIVFGMLYYEKGIDRLVDVWLRIKNKEKCLLVIAGKKRGNYKELEKLQEKLNLQEQILYIDGYIEDDLLNYLINKSNVVTIPYRHASMSGVLFSAASFKRTVMATDTGALSEYIIPNQDGFLVNNSDESIKKCIEIIIQDYTTDDLVEMGQKLHENISTNYSWEKIVGGYLNEYCNS